MPTIRRAPVAEAGTATEVPEPAGAAEVFGDRVALAREYVALLLTEGIERGLIGPREQPRIWDRHVFNCAALAEALPTGARIADVGSGAGLPGLVLAIRRPDLRVTLVDSLLRRVEFLSEAVTRVGLEATVRVVHGRAEDASVREAVAPIPWVTARAVAPLDRLARWCVPLLEPDGVLLAMKGASAEAELAGSLPTLRRAGASRAKVLELAGMPTVPEVRATVIVVRRDGRPGASRRAGELKELGQ